MNNSPLWLSVITILFLALGEPLPAQCEVLQRRIVDVGGLRTGILTVGIEDRKQGEHLLIFQNGIGSTMEMWDAVIKEVASFAAVLAYDRPGIGASDSDSTRPTFVRVSEHLHQLLSVLKAAPPYILVGHSWGGPLVEHFACEHRGDVTGLIFIDPPDWTQEGIFPLDRATLAARGFNSAQVDSMVVLRDSLVLDWKSWMDEWSAQSPGIAADWQVFKSFMSAPVDERGLPSSPPVPTAILVAGRIEPMMQFSEDLVRAYRASRYRSFSRLILDLPNSMLIIDTGTGHEIPVEDPTLVSEVIRRVILNVKQLSNLPLMQTAPDSGKNE
jgi:pimeloyl-ACP methyl ester carboxylesterase